MKCNIKANLQYWHLLLFTYTCNLRNQVSDKSCLSLKSPQTFCHTQENKTHTHKPPQNTTPSKDKCGPFALQCNTVSFYYQDILFLFLIYCLGLISSQTVLLLKKKPYICPAVFKVTHNYRKLNVTCHPYSLPVL